jgi:hypothetical protein
MGRVINTLGMGTYGSTWQHEGYSGCGNVEPILGSLKGRPAIVCGNAWGVFDELHEAEQQLENPVIFGVNDVGMYLPRLDHWISLHATNLLTWKSVRWLTLHELEATKYHSIEGDVDYNWEGLCPLLALSGYFAMQVAHLMGAGLIVLCGCPGAPARRFFEREAKIQGYGGTDSAADKAIQDQLVLEVHRVPELREKVISMSGFTQELFGGF